LEEEEVICREEEEVAMMIGVDIIVKMNDMVVNLGPMTQEKDKTTIINTEKENKVIIQVMMEVENSRGGGRIKITLHYCDHTLSKSDNVCQQSGGITACK